MIRAAATSNIGELSDLNPDCCRWLKPGVAASQSGGGSAAGASRRRDRSVSQRLCFTWNTAVVIETIKLPQPDMSTWSQSVGRTQPNSNTSRDVSEVSPGSVRTLDTDRGVASCGVVGDGAKRGPERSRSHLGLCEVTHWIDTQVTDAQLNPSLHERPVLGARAPCLPPEPCMSGQYARQQPHRVTRRS